MPVPSGSPFSFDIVARDRFSAVFASLDKKLAGIPSKAVAAGAGAERGVRSVGRAFGDLDRATKDLGTSIAGAIRPLERFPFVGAGLGVGALATAAYGLADAWSHVGGNLLRSSQNLGIGVEQLQALRGGAVLAGSSAEALASGLGTLQEKLHGAAWGRDADAIAALRQMHISPRDAATGQIRNPAQVLPQIADEIARQKEVSTQAEMATRLFGAAGRDLLPYLREGAAGVQRYNAQAVKYGVMNKDAVAAARDFEQAQSQLDLAVSGLSNTIVAQYGPALANGIRQTDSWIKALRENKGAMDAVQPIAVGLAGVFGLTMVGAVLKLTRAVWAFNAAWAANPLVVGGAALGALGYGGYKGMQKAGAEAEKRGVPSAAAIVGSGGAVPAAALGPDAEKVPSGPAAPQDVRNRELLKSILNAVTGVFGGGETGGPRATASIPPPGAYRRGGIVPAAAGGWVVPSSFGSDTVPSMLTPGEMVLPRDLSAGLARLIRGAPLLRGAAAGGPNFRPVARGLAEAVPEALGRADYAVAGRAISSATGEALRRDLPGVFLDAWRDALGVWDVAGDAGARRRQAAVGTGSVVPGRGAAAVVPGPGAPAVVPGRGAAPVVPGPGAPAVVPGRGAAPVVPGPGAPAVVPGRGAAPVVPGPGAPRPVPKPTAPVPSAVPPEARGLLDALASRESEGAARRLGVSPYNVRYTPKGGAVFANLAKHPHIYEPGPAGPSSAAGRYQFTWATWQSYAKKLGLTDFGTASQDRAAWADAQSVYKHATGRDLGGDLQRHYFDPRAVAAFHREWASVQSDLPQLTERFAGRYRQPTATASAPVPGPVAAAPPAVGPYAEGGAAGNATRHEVEVSFANAPQGMRAGVGRAEGPADLALRLRYAMGGV